MGYKLTAVSLFSGCGGFDWGAQQAGAEIIWANDIDAHCAAAYQSLFPNVEFVLDDIQNIKAFPKADILIGCYPCTGFSLGARRRWRNLESRSLYANENNFLYREFLRALRQVRPKYLFVENVRGMVSAESGWFLKQQLSGFRKLGYRVKYALLDASDFGVPQSRKRIFIVGVQAEENAIEYDFPQPTHGHKGVLPHRVLHDAIGYMKEWPKGEYFDYPFHGHYLTRNRKRGWNELSYTIVADAHHVPLHPMGKPMKFIKKDTWALQGKDNRRLSWRECAAIQGLPPNATPSGTLMDKYRVVGNAVPPALGKALLVPIVKFEAAT
jgi:DNA (cytosine-5)-methyltransferase 1